MPYELNDETKLTFYNTISDANKLTGMQYYSRRADEVKTLVINAYPTTKRWMKIKDLQPMTEIQPHITGYFRQKDNKFGLMSFQADLYNERNNFVMVNTCKTPIPFVCYSDEYKTITYFIYDEKSAVTKGRRTGKTFKVGDSIDIVVSGADTNLLRVDFMLKKDYYGKGRGKKCSLK